MELTYNQILKIKAYLDEKGISYQEPERVSIEEIDFEKVLLSKVNVKKLYNFDHFGRKIK